MSDTDLFGSEAPDPRPVVAEIVVPPQPKKDRIRGIVKLCVAGEDYRLEMRESGVSARRVKKKHVSHKSLQQILDFVTEQPQLPLEGHGEVIPVPHPDMEELLEYCIEYVALHIYDSNAPGKKFQRLKFASDALQAKVEELAPGKIAERLGKI